MQARAGMMMKPSLASNALRRTALKILGEGGHVEVAVCVGENGDVFVGHGFILPATIVLGGGCKLEGSASINHFHKPTRITRFRCQIDAGRNGDVVRNPLQPALVSFYEGCGLRRKEHSINGAVM